MHRSDDLFGGVIKEYRDAVGGLDSERHARAVGEISVAGDFRRLVIALAGIRFVDIFYNVRMYLTAADDRMRVDSDGQGEELKIFEYGFVVVAASEGEIERLGMRKTADSADSRREAVRAFYFSRTEEFNAGIYEFKWHSDPPAAFFAFG